MASSTATGRRVLSPSSVAALLLLSALAGACDNKQVVAGFPDEFVGIGVELTRQDDSFVVVRTLAGGSAEQAGMLPGDRVMLIDGRPLTGVTLGDVVMRIRGAPGSQVTIAVERGQQRLIIVMRRKGMAKGEKSYRPTSP